jgi:hypothetical protein
MHARSPSALAGAALLLAACGGGPWPSAKQKLVAAARDTAYESSRAAEQEAASPPDAGAAAPDAAAFMRKPPENVSFETALRVQTDGSNHLQDEQSADQLDYYVFSGTAGEFYELRTDTGDFTPDNVISLYDAEHTLIAENDSGSIWPGDAIDARLVVRVPSSGDYYVAVEDRLTPPEFFHSSFPLLYYHLSVRALGADATAVAHEGDAAPATVAFVQDATSGYGYATLLGEFGAGDDAFTFIGSTDQALIGHALPSGSSGNGGSAQGGRVRVATADEHGLAEIDRGRGQENIRPPVTDGTFRVTLSADGDLGANAFYAVDLVLLPDNPREQNDADNGALAGAETVAMKGGNRRRGLLLSTLPAKDIDYYQFDAAQNEHVSVLCEGESGGSGVRGLRAELRDDADTMLASALETEVANLQINAVQVGAAGTYYLRLTSDATPKAPVNEPWVRCAIIASR